MIPIVNLFETYNSAYVIPVYRTISVINTFLCSWMLYKICKECTKMPYVAFLSVLLFLSLEAVYVFSLVLRPDNFMLLFGLWGFYVLLKYRQTQNIKLLYFCGFLFFISFMFLQKIIFLFMAIAVFVHEDIQHKKLKWMPFIKTGMCFVGSYILFLWGLYEINALSPYFYYNFLFNVQINASRYYLPDFQEWLYLIVCVFSCLYVIRKEKNEDLLFVSKIAMLFFLITIITGTPQSYYFVFPICLFLPATAYTLITLFKRTETSSVKYLIFAGILCCVLYFPMSIVLSFSDNNTTPLKMIQYVLDNVPKGETVFNGDINRISLFHKNSHPFRHNLTLNYSKSEDFNWGLSYDEIRKMIKEKKPYLIIASWPLKKELTTEDTNSNTGFSIKLDEEILEMYEKEPEFGFYIRKK